MARGNRVASLHRFLLQLDQALEKLPSAEERARLLDGLAQLRMLVEALERGLATIPTSGEAETARRAARDVRSFFDRAEADPLLARLLAGQRAPRPRTSHARSEATGGPEIGPQIDALSKMSVDEAQRVLEGDHYSLTDVRKIAIGLGIRGGSKLPRAALAHQIVMKLANYRGYQQLSGDKQGV
jgi:hypothetical protein